MRLVRYGAQGSERPGLIDDEDVLRDLSGHVADIGGPALLPETLARLARIDPSRLPRVDAAPRLGPCVTGTDKILCIGLNYGCTARELGLARPAEPAMALKPPSVLAGANDPITIPSGREAVDWEVELGIVIGLPARRVTTAEALNHVAGYVLVNDLAERHDQRHRGGESSKGRCHDGFGPIGPWLLTADAVPDPQNLRLWLEIDGNRVQDGTTADMFWGVAELVAYLSEFMTLRTGDIIFSGTPAGIGAGQRPPRFLRPGQVVRLGGDGLGEQRAQVDLPRFI